MDDFQIVVSVCLGIGLSAACGFRVFVPLLCLSIAAMTGHVHLSDSFAWVGTMPAMIAFAVATVLEIGAYYIPFVDNVLDSIAVPLAGAAGVFVSALAMSDLDPFWRWALAIIAGGGIATTTQLATTKLRAVSTATTAGVANPLLATIEAVIASVLSFVAVVWPIVAMIAAILLVVGCWVLFWFAAKRLIRLLRRPVPAASTPAAPTGTAA